MAITAGSGTPCLPASVTNPDLKLCAPKSPYKPASRARRFTIVASEPGRRGGPTRPFQTRLKIAPSWILAASSQDAKASALRPQVQQSRASEQQSNCVRTSRPPNQRPPRPVSLPISCAANVTCLRGNFQGFEICQLSWKWRSSDPKKFVRLRLADAQNNSAVPPSRAHERTGRLHLRRRPVR